ncbi:flagellar hook-associated protein FlgK [Qipengyuania thermophila]|uniref:flagellar hook-associated protein FlgK n=1 Tax=Qipengyuania thermophila TaxID=2509361 RepID=UPI0013EE3608|nr:flagellar hook-associated protein FlgK [Qipengyuania thermophila]
MTGTLLQIGRSGAHAARAALDTSAHNIANSATPGYTRRAARLSVAPAGLNPARGPIAGGGVTVAGVSQPETRFLRAETRRADTALARAAAELDGLLSGEAALQRAGLSASLDRFEASLAKLASAPLEPALRLEVLERAGAVAAGFNAAHGHLATAGDEHALRIEEGVAAANGLAASLGELNLRLSRSQPESAAKATLLDQRDALLARLVPLTGATVRLDAVGRAVVQLGDGGPLLLGPAGAAALRVERQSDGAMRFLAGAADAPGVGGELAGREQARSHLARAVTALDDAARQLAGIVNTAQAGGATPSGSAGAPLFSGEDAATLAVCLSDPDALATAGAGAPVRSRDTRALDALRTALAHSGPAAAVDAIGAGLAASIAARTGTRDLHAAFAQSAHEALGDIAGIDLDAEAASLLRFQQLFQASGKVMQTAARVFDSLLEIGR